MAPKGEALQTRNGPEDVIRAAVLALVVIAGAFLSLAILIATHHP